MATLTTKARKDLKPSDFAWVDPRGVGHLPIPNADHVRAALQRWPQLKFGWTTAEKTKARDAIIAAAKEFGVKVSDTSLPMAEPTALIALDFGEIDLSEGKPIPFMCSGQWNFTDYGEFAATPEDLIAVKTMFDEAVRRQDLPIINEDHDKSRAVGWIKSIDFDGPDKLVAVPEWTELGEQLIQDKAYRYTSPELLADWADPEHPNVRHPLVATGLAITNKPRIKALGSIAATEASPSVSLIACGEASGTMSDVRNNLVQSRTVEPEPAPLPLGNDFTPLTIAIFGNASPPQETSMTETATTDKTSVELAETKAQLVALAERATAAEKIAAEADVALKASETKTNELAATVEAMKRRETAAGIKARLAECVRTGRITPAEEAALSESEDNLVALSEKTPFVIAALEARAANVAIDFRERGTSGEADKASAHEQLVAMAEAKRKDRPELSHAAAYAEALTSNPELARAAIKGA